MTTELIVKLLMGVGMMVAFALKKRAQAERESRGKTLVSQRTSSPAGSEAEEQIRRVQEEIRRKIAARANRPQVAPVAPPPVPRRADARANPRERELQQAALQEKLRRAQELVSVKLQPAAAPPTPAIGLLPYRIAPADTSGIPSNPLISELRDPARIRRAIILREILGPQLHCAS